MLIVAENINIMSKSLGPAFKERNPKPLQDAAVKLAENGADYLDLNIGPARKDDDLMGWVVTEVQEVVDLPLFLDTTNTAAVESGLKAYKPKRGRAVINSVLARPESMDARLPLAARYNAQVVALTIGPSGIPRDDAERGVLAAELLYHAAEAGVMPEDMFVDPFIPPISQQALLKHSISFTAMIKEIDPSLNSTCGLSNVSNGPPVHLRPVLNQTLLLVLKYYGMSSAILDGYDRELIAMAKGGRPDLETLVGKIVREEPVDIAALNEEEKAIAKTARVVLGRSLYSESWLDL